MPHRPGMSGRSRSSGATIMSQRGRPDVLDQRARPDAGPDAAEVGVERAHRDGNAGRQAGLFRPLRAQRPRRLADVVGVVRAASGAGGPGRSSSCARNSSSGIAAPGRVEHGLVAGGADAALDGVGMRRPRQHGGQPVGVLDPGVGGLVDIGVGMEAAQDLGPVPFGAVGAAALGEVLRADLRPPAP